MYLFFSVSVFRCNTDINDSDCDVSVLRGINFNVQNPKEVDTFVRVEFPYPAVSCVQDASVGWELKHTIRCCNHAHLTY